MAELNDFEKELLAMFDKSKPVFFQKEVCDCEHEGDMRHAITEVSEFIKPFGGKVTKHFWDGHDCGEAYVECSVPYDKAQDVIESGFFFYDPWQVPPYG